MAGCCAALIFLLFSGRSWAGDPGTAGANFLKIGAGPRAIGMGEAHLAVSDDPYATYWNPAGLAQIEQTEASLMHNQSFQDISQQFLAAVHPLRYGSTLGLSLTRLGVGEFDSYDANGARLGTVDASDWALGISYGRRLQAYHDGTPRWMAGATVKLIRESLAEVSAQTFAGDIGFLYRENGDLFPNLRGVKLGLAVRNLGPGLKFDRESTPLPRTYSAALAYERLIFGDPLTFALDANLPVDNDLQVHFGGEYWAYRILALRLGFRSGQDIGTGFRAGVGFKFKFLQLDYAFASFGELGQMHRAGISAKLGGPIEVTPIQPKTAKDFLLRGRELMGEGRLYEAILDFNQALEKDPGNRQALESMKQAHEELKKR